MKIEDNDWRTTDWHDEGHFRIILFDGPAGAGLPEWAVFLPTADVLSAFAALREEDLVPSGYNTEIVDVLDADFVDVHELASRLAGQSKYFAITLVVPESAGGPGEIWLTGTDLNRAGPDNATQARQREIMLSRPRRADEEAERALEWLRDQP
ncbi:hypothetical protein ACFVU2_14040 [Leifsonia sp. NPDC058194]|uniref:hypothetical protein n=1 Tax=Leifsonia sp. NPDC058194 TaxID=3346374 RepID=UPI0036D8E351